MRLVKIIFIASILFLSLSSCERDEICLEDITPRLVVRFYNNDIPDEEKTKLDEIEGLGFGYEEKIVSVELHNGEIVEVFTYYATNIDPNLKPLHWYKEHVLIGARENGLPEEYIKKIEIVESISDADVARHEKELSIYLLKKKKCLVDPEG